MSDHLVRRVDPRALIRESSEVRAFSSNAGVAVRRMIAVSLAAAVGLGAFGTVVVKANDDNGVLAFVRTQSRSIAAAPRPTQYVQPTSYYAPRAFFPSARTSAVPQPSYQPAAPAPRNRAIVASYAPFTGFFPGEQIGADQPRRKAQPRVRDTAFLSLPSPNRAVREATPSAIELGGRVTYCVRTCDGFFFPIGNGSGNQAADTAACNRLCPTAETKVYTGQLGEEIDNARSRENGRRYASLSTAFSHRRSVDKSCSCSANGFGLTNDLSAFRDQSLRTGDIVMTGTGLKVFNGGSYPYREANFTAITRSDRLNAATRETLRKIEQASFPAPTRAPQVAATTKGQNELNELKSAMQSAQQRTDVVRYVGPDRSLAR